MVLCNLLCTTAVINYSNHFDGKGLLTGRTQAGMRAQEKIDIIPKQWACTRIEGKNSLPVWGRGRKQHFVNMIGSNIDNPMACFNF